MRREIVKHPVPLKKTKKLIPAETPEISPPCRTPPRKNQEQHPEFTPKHQYCLLSGREKCGGCVYKDVLMQKYQKKN